MGQARKWEEEEEVEQGRGVIGLGERDEQEERGGREVVRNVYWNC